ncbi:hypothetical protein B0T17DRAFT_591280 [Bombardia bombarda]|uniref:Uncharacterized protein n=1 Tax=Bombardia bombarda TaxID=252184 RepID=A0AA40C1U0_9PEZI|nr:hypothetical protein B0T17DRAFT_591280 [Bombardia bombarda]
MEEGERMDPFLWDVDRVVRELCTSKRSWISRSAPKLPDPARLEALIRDQEVDGETLLTYQDEFSVKMLWEALEIKKAPHQLSVNAAIKQFKNRSPLYRDWKRRQLDESNSGSDEDVTPSAKRKSPNKDYPRPTAQTLSNPEPTMNGTHAVHNMTLEEEASIHRPVSPSPSDKVQDAPIADSGGLERMAEEESTPRASSSESSISEEPPSKKRRFMTTGDESLNREPEEFLDRPSYNSLDNTTEDFLLDLAGEFAYLGSAALKPGQITRLSVTDDSDTSLSLQEFSIVRPRGILLGRQLQISQTMKRFLRSGVSISDHIDPEPEDDNVLPQFGESDDDESLDSGTWRELQDEEQGLQNAKVDIPELSKEEVNSTIKDAIQDLEAVWTATKRPQLENTARTKWNKARRHHSRMHDIQMAKDWLEHLDSRRSQNIQDILHQQWHNKDEVKQKATNWLDLTVFDSLKQHWLITLLEDPRQPAKLAKNSIPRPKKELVPSGEDEEILTSESEGDNDFIDDRDDNFIDDRDDNAIFGFDEMEIDSNQHQEQEQNRSPVSQTHSRATTPQDRGSHDLHQTPLQIEGGQAEETKLKPDTPPEPRATSPEITDIQSSADSRTHIPIPPPLEDPVAIADVGVEYWQKVGDNERLTIAVLYNWSLRQRQLILDAVANHSHKEIWDLHVLAMLQEREVIQTDGNVLGFYLMKLFDCYVAGTADRLEKRKIHTATVYELRQHKARFRRLCSLIQGAAPQISPSPATLKTPTRRKKRVRSSQTPENVATQMVRMATEDPEEEPEADKEEPEVDIDAMSEGSSDADDMPKSSAKKRRRNFQRRDEGAKDLRETTRRHAEELDQRRRLLREKMAQDGAVPGDKSRLIVNETKESDEQALIYINESIGSKIKDHQIEGVRFMWNQVVVQSRVRQGCLLAHTMGLGKTMQVITLLVVIAEASSSQDPSVYSQIPEELRTSKTIILCPAGLVENWIDEIAIWAPKNLLGQVFKLSSAVPDRDRYPLVKEWASVGGMLVTGYDLFTSLVRGDEDIGRLLHESPNIVIGDEAHNIKNPKSFRHQSTAGFRTMSRIAMTGSPLTNNVMDYYAMINWVAPNYLADIAEFKQRFSNPINEGLYADSNPNAKRKARKLLHVLKATVDPKVHRKDINVLLKELPAKKEFIITVPLTPIQKKAYEAYLESLMNSKMENQVKGQAGIWSLVAILKLLLAHPQIFKWKLENPQKDAKTTQKSARVGAGDGDEDDMVFPQDLMSDVLATVSHRDIQAFTHSNKVMVLFKILDECKRVGDKVLIFSQSIATLDYLEDIFNRQKRRFNRLDGATKISGRQDSIKKFNSDDEAEGYLISTKAGGVGLNIYGANRVVIFDFKYTPTDEQQAIGRAYRIGQTKQVYVYWLTVGGTFESTVHNNAVFKSQLASRVVDKKNPDPWSRRIGNHFAMPTIPNHEDYRAKMLGEDEVLDVLLKDDNYYKLMPNVTTTETFEKEEEYELTPEDQREAEQDIELERLRIQDPEEFKRRDQERLQRMGADINVASYFGGVRQATSAGGKSRMEDVFTSHNNPGKTSRLIKILVPEHMRGVQIQGQPISASNPASNGISPAGNPANESVLPNLRSDYQQMADPLTSQAASRSTIGAPNPMEYSMKPPPGQQIADPLTSQALSPSIAGELTPIFASGSYFAPTPSVRPSVWPSVQSPGSRAGGISRISRDENESRVCLALQDAFDRVRAKNPLTPDNVITRINTALDGQQFEGLPRVDKLQNVEKYLKPPHNRFAEAVLAGHIIPAELALMERAQLEEKSAQYNAMSEADFQNEVWTRSNGVAHVGTTQTAT